MSKTFLLEIGSEEIPARFMASTLEQLKNLAIQGLNRERLDYQEVRTMGTPRRLALIVEGMADQQRQQQLEIKGPARKVAFDEQGRPTKAAAGFARNSGVDVSDLEIRATPAGEYVFAVKREEGRPAPQVLAELAPSFIHALAFPKPMRWGYSDFRFARPIHWLVAMLGQEVIPFRLEDLESGRVTYGHRFLGQGAITLEQADHYMEQLAANHVVVDQVRRRDMIWRQVLSLAAAEGGIVKTDEDLLEEITYLVEYPTALCGHFPESYLELPAEVLITPMREHQRYFPIWDQQDRLLPKFIAVRNGTDQHLAIVAAGNEKVLKARLADARFFFEEDLKQPLADLVPRLGDIVFLENLGSMASKVERIRALAEILANRLGWSAQMRQDADRTALLAKADLVTAMVYEFPELQGIMGSEYAVRSGEKPEVAAGIREHYLPRFSGDQLPAAPLGVLISIADKLDSVVGCFAVGIQPTGSQDPYALRRQALAICTILRERGLELILNDLIEQAYELYAADPAVNLRLERTELEREIMEFMRLRLRGMLLEQGITYDVADAVLAAGFSNVPDLFRRAAAVQQLKGTAQFSDLITAFTRAHNLAVHAGAAAVNPELFETEFERNLFQTSSRTGIAMDSALENRQVAEALVCLAQLQQPVAEFFEGIMVMVEDAAIRQNRLALLRGVSELGRKVADFTKIVIV